MQKENLELVKQAAEKLYCGLLSQGYQLEVMYEYRDKNNEIFDYKLRFTHKSKSKEIRSMSWNEKKNGYVLQQKYFNGEKRPLYNLPMLLSNVNDPVFICEGENCVDTLTLCGVLATTSGGAQSAAQADWQPLAGREVLVWPDKDKAGKAYANAVSEILIGLGCSIKIIDVDQLGLSEKEDVVDWMRSNPNATTDDLLRLPTSDYSNQNIALDQSTQDQQKENHIDLAIKVFHEKFELFNDKDKKIYAADKNTGENYLIDDDHVTDLVSRELYARKKFALDDNLRKKLLSILKAEGLYNSPCYQVALRVGEHNGWYYLDLAQNGNSDAVEIKSGSFDVIKNPPIRFIRPPAMKALPVPNAIISEISYDKLNILWEIVNIPEFSRPLVLAWLLECLRPDTPFPALELIGEQGAAKSTTQKYLRRLIDPSTVDLRGAPKSCDDIAVSAQVNHILSYENMSHLNQNEQDTLCTIATGGGYSKRQLYSDGKEYIINCKNPVMINGINEVVTSQDLVSRTITVELEQIKCRQEVNHIDKKFEENRAEILGALLILFAKSLERVANIQLPADNQPRLVEFVKLGMAMSEELGNGAEKFLEIYQAMGQASINRTIESNSVAVALIDWLDSSEANAIKLDTFTVKDLYRRLNPFKDLNKYTAWPRSPRGFADQLRRCAPALRQLNINIEFPGQLGGYYRVEIRDKREKAKQCHEPHEGHDDMSQPFI